MLQRKRRDENKIEHNYSRTPQFVLVQHRGKRLPRASRARPAGALVGIKKKKKNRVGRQTSDLQPNLT